MKLADDQIHLWRPPVLLITVAEDSVWPQPPLIRAISAVMHECDDRAHLHLRRSSSLERGSDVQLLGDWRCAPHQVRQALAALYCDMGTADG